PAFQKAALRLMCYAAAIAVCLWVIVEFPFRLERLPHYFFAPVLAFFFAGMALSMFFHLTPEVVSTLYFADLAGASRGALLVTVLLEWAGSESTLLIVAAAPLAASAFLSKRYRTAAVLGAVIVAGFAVSNERML